MLDAILEFTSVTIVGPQASLWKTSFKKIITPSFLVFNLNPHPSESDKSDPVLSEDADDTTSSPVVDRLSQTTPLSPVPNSLRYEEHNTQPPHRFSESSLIRTLEELGIGRPSTFANIIETLLQRKYVTSQPARSLSATFTGIVVHQFLQKHFQHIVDPSFTQRMELSLDQIAAGSLDARSYIDHFYREQLSPLIASTRIMPADEIDTCKLVPASALLPAANLVLQNDFQAELRVGIHGPYLKSATIPHSIPIPDSISPDRLTPDLLQIMVVLSSSPMLGIHPELNLPIHHKLGRFGAYLECGSLTIATPLQALTLAEAISLFPQNAPLKKPLTKKATKK